MNQRNARLWGGLVLGAALCLAVPAFAQQASRPEATAKKATLLHASDVAWTVKLDGEKVAELQAVLRGAEAAVVEIEAAKTRIEELDLRWVAIPAGKFRMGCSPRDRQCSSDEEPAHAVQITKAFQMMATEVTAGQFRTWARSQGHEPPAQPEWSAPNMPVVNVTWADSQAFCSAFGGRLPTEAEWEYAARGGSETARYGPLDSVAWYADNSGRDRLHSKNMSGEGFLGRLKANGNKAHPVAVKQPNRFGLYDMLGNVWEWCGDWYGDDYYKQEVETDPTGPSFGQYRVLRGGSFLSVPWYVRVSYRYRNSPTTRFVIIGFRCVREANSPVR